MSPKTSALIFICLCFQTCTADRLIPVDECGAPCGSIDGECRPGVLVCGDAGAECIGAVLPSQEECNGLDDDCDGKTDAFARRCETVCGGGSEFCHLGEWTECTARRPAPETCNGLDDDCNLLTDDSVAALPCYTGPAGTLGKGICRPGFTSCAGGQTSCNGQALPVKEKCNGLDDDCDGSVDEGADKPVDLVFVVDNSCSMGPYLAQLSTATAQWAQRYANTSLRLALVTAPDKNQAYDEPRLYHDLCGPADFAVAMAQQTPTGSALEPTLDAIAQVVDGRLALSWRSNSTRAVIVYSDELAQSYDAPANTGPSVSAAAIDAGVDVAVFTSAFQGWDPLSQYPLSADVGPKLEAILSSLRCGP